MMVLNLTMINCSSALVPKPSVPEFALKFADHSYEIPTTYSTDPYTGENVTHAGYHVQSITLEVTIKNQPFVPYDEGGWRIEFFYNIREKGHYSEDFMELYRPSDGYPTQSNSEYTVVSLGTLGENGLSLATNAKMFDVPSGGQMDFQVEAMIGYVSRVYNPNATGPFDIYPWVFTGETSGWSNTQTLDIPVSTTSLEDSTSQTPSSTPNPPSWTSPTSTADQPAEGASEEPLQTSPSEKVLGTFVAVFVVVVGVLVYWKKHKQTYHSSTFSNKNQLSQEALAFLVSLVNEGPRIIEKRGTGICSTFVQKYPHMFNFRAILCPYG